MKAILLILGLLVSVQSSAIQGGQETTSFVVKAESDTIIRFTGEIMADSCNAKEIAPELTLIANDPTNKTRTYTVTPHIVSQTAYCPDMSKVPRYVESQNYKVNAGSEVTFIVPAWAQVEIVEAN